MLGVLQHAVRWLEESAGVRPDLVVTLQPTSPFRTGAEIDRTIETVLGTGSDSAQTLVEASYHPFFMKTLDGDRTVALFPDGPRLRAAPGRAAGVPAVGRGLRDALRRPHGPTGTILGDDNRGVVMGFEASVNIDTEWDFLLAELILREGRAPIGPGRR